MSFTCPKCAKCMKPTGECCENCLSIEKRVNRGQHYIALNLWREKKQLHKKLTIKMVDDVIDALQEIVPKEFDDDKIHTKILEEHYSRLKSARAIKILIVDDKSRELKEFNDELNRKMFPRGREAAVKELEEKIEEAGCVNQENKS